MTKPPGYRQCAAEAAFLLFAFWLPHFQSLIFAGIGRTIVALLLAYLLIFLVANSADICRVLTSCLLAIRSCDFRLSCEEFRAITFASPREQNAPSLSPLFQRPPPLCS